MTVRLAIPGAIIIGSVIIAAAVYLGLSGRGDGLETPAVVATTATVSDQPPPRTAKPPAPRPSLAEIEAAARAAFERARPAMLERCWTPALARNPEPATSEYLIDVTFDGTTGKAVAMGLSEVRGRPSRPDVARCMRELPLDHAISPPGENTRVEISLTFP
jgi:hypothetical protein